MMKMQVANIKVTLYLDRAIEEKLDKIFNIYRLPDGGTLTVYSSKPKLIHLTGFTSLDELPGLKRKISQYFKHDFKFISEKVNAVMLNYKASQESERINIPQFYQIMCEEKPKYEPQYNPELFPSASLYCHYRDTNRKIYVQVFHSGSVQALGLRALSDRPFVEQFVSEILALYRLKTTQHP